MKDAQFDIKSPQEPVCVDLPGRLFVPGDEREAPCRIVALSPDGASLRCEMGSGPGAAIVLYVNGLGRFEGTITHKDGQVLDVKFVCTAAKRERTAEQIAALGDTGVERGSILRRHGRSNHKGHIQFTRANGQIVSCEIIDISVGGVSLRTDTRPLVGEFVLIAQLAGRVSRYNEQGIDVEFVGREL